MWTIVDECVGLDDRIPDGTPIDGVWPAATDPHPAASTQEEDPCKIEAEGAPLFIISGMHWIYAMLPPTSE